MKEPCVVCITLSISSGSSTLVHVLAFQQAHLDSGKHPTTTKVTKKSVMLSQDHQVLESSKPPTTYYESVQDDELKWIYQNTVL